MLINPRAARRLRAATAYSYWPFTTHHQRNELARMFNEEADKLLDQKAESTIKRTVELYSAEEISYERYIELIEEVGKEEAARGASYGGDYARNRVFDYAQKTLDQVKDRAYQLSLAEARKQYELEKQKTEQSLQEVVQRYLERVQEISQEHKAALKDMTQAQQEVLTQRHKEAIDETKDAIEQIVSTRLQEERKRREQEIRAEEELRPAREAARMAIARVTLLEKQMRRHRGIKRGLFALDVVLVLALIVFLVFLPFPQWAAAVMILFILMIVPFATIWRGPIPEERLTTYQRDIAHFQTQGGDFASLSEEERCRVLIQRIG